MYKAILIIGGNIQDREFYLLKAKLEIERNIGKIEKASSIYETEAWGFDTSQSFLNQVFIVSTTLKPLQIITCIQKIENKLGRIRNSTNYESRTIDIDVLFIDNLIINYTNLIIPHPLIEKRLFVLVPLAEIIPNFIHPVLKQTIIDILTICKDTNRVSKFATKY